MEKGKFFFKGQSFAGQSFKLKGASGAANTVAVTSLVVVFFIGYSILLTTVLA